MDNLSHSLTGLALAHAGLRKYTAHATAILLVSANAPDLDIVTLAGGSLRYLENHRGYTHSILGMPVMAAISVLIVAAIFRTRLAWGRAWLLALVGIASHFLLDLTNSYGIRLGLPFTSRWFYLDLNSLTDGFFVAVLALSALWPVLANLVSGEIGERRSNGRAIAITAILALCAFESWRMVLHARVIGKLQSRDYEEQRALRVAALPDAFNPFRWTGIVETESAFLRIETSGTGQPQWRDAQIFYKPPQSAAWAAAKKAESFRFLVYFSRFPAWSFVPVTVNNSRGVRVELTDLRFGSPGGGSFHCYALVDSASRVVDQHYSWTAEP